MIFRIKLALLAIATVLFAWACQELTGSTADLLSPTEAFGGGGATVFDESENAFGHAAPNLKGEKDLEFVSGNSFFRRNWVTAPASTEDLDGLGPMFNVRSCGGCHFKDGKAAPPSSRDEDPVGLLFRLGRPSSNGSLPDPNYGSQFHPNAILGVEAEGKVSVEYREIQGNYPDGRAYSIREPIYHFANLNYGDWPSDMQVSPRIAPQMVGLGLLEAIDEATILAIAAEQEDVSGGEITGKPNYVWNELEQKNTLGRFGWKANMPTVRQQVAGAFNGDLGITSSIFSNQPCADNQADCHDAPSGGNPELSSKILDRVTLYSATLAVPKRRNWDSEEVLEGKSLFLEIGCGHCHRPNITTGTEGEHPEFHHQPIHPYTDLLLHDMGEDLADNRPDGLANGREWKTPPLWGLGLLKTVNNHEFLLHDGRARGFEEAILWHGGEAETAKNNFMNLDAEERNRILIFLKSL